MVQLKVSGQYLMVQSLELFHKVVVVLDMSGLVAIHDAVQVREVPVKVHTVVIRTTFQVVPPTLG